MAIKDIRQFDEANCNKSEEQTIWDNTVDNADIHDLIGFIQDVVHPAGYWPNGLDSAADRVLRTTLKNLEHNDLWIEAFENYMK